MNKYLLYVGCCSRSWGYKDKERNQFLCLGTSQSNDEDGHIEIMKKTEILCARYSVSVEGIRKYLTEFMFDLDLEGGVGVCIWQKGQEHFKRWNYKKHEV